MKRLDEKLRYSTFSNAKNKALEGLLLKARARVGDDLRHFMLLVQLEVQRSYPTFNLEFLDPYTANNIRALDQSIDRHAYTISIEMTSHWLALRSYVYTLAHASEQQAVIQTKNGKPHKISKDDVHKAVFAPTQFGSVEDRAYLSLSRIRRDVIDAVEMSRIMGDALPACMERVLKAFPRPEIVKQPRALRRIKEADYIKKNDSSLLDFVDEQEWEEILDEYKSEFVPKWRDPRAGTLESPVSIGDEDGFVVYPYQLENELTEDFVQKVRDGEHEGAKSQGITDFVWIAVVDNRTDKCCLKRDGLTTAEIKDKLEGEWQKDECRGVTPPIHPNCRCRLAPATDDIPDAPENGTADFEEWLNS